jgi:CheY-like chemotaxis protein
MHLLWADDQVSAARSLGAVLPSAKCDVVYVADGESALSRLRNEAFDAVILDLLMPPGEWGGLWLLEQLRNLDIRVPVVVVSGEGSQTETIRAMRLGARDYVMKDRVETELLDRIEAAVRNDALALMKGGESYTVEFKSTARWDVKESRPNSEMGAIIIRTIAGFLNSDTGGNLFIGVDDGGNAIGLDHDYKTLGKHQNRDGFENWIISQLSDAIGKHVGRLVRISFVDIGGKDVCHVLVQPSPTAVYICEKNVDQLYVRTGNSTRALSAREAVEYYKQRWP